MKFEDFDLRQDPFPIAPESHVINWAGDHEIRDYLIDIVSGVRARDIGVTEFVVLHGEYGAGKSHALRYLKTYIDDHAADFNSLAIYLERPRVATKLNFENLAKYIFQKIGRDRVKSICASVSKVLDDIVNEIAEQKGMANAQNKETFYEEAYSRFREADRPMLRLLRSGTRQESRIFEFLIGDERCDTADYEGKIDSDFISAKVLGDFFRVITTDLKDGQPLYDAVYLFIDECEMLFDAKATEADLIFAGLRELLNGLPYRFGLLMSFSAATALIEAVMPNHLLRRMTRDYVEIPILSTEQAAMFIRSQLDFYRTPKSRHAGTYYPFSDEAIETIIEHETNLTPRNLFIYCKRVLERAIRRLNLQPGDTISADDVRSILGYA